MSRSLSPFDQAHAAIRCALDAGEISEDTYFKGVVGLAAQMAEEKLYDDAATMLSKVSVSYIRTVLPVQMESEMVFTNALGLAKDLEAAGLAVAPDEEVLMPVASTSSFQN